MPRRLSKEESRQRHREGRDLWNKFDPIGVADEVDDEYDSYVGPCLRLTEAGKEPAEIQAYVRHIVFEYMGLNESVLLERAIASFSTQFSEWYRTKWADTVV